MSICHLYIFFSELSFQNFCFLIGMFVIFLLGFKSSLNILNGFTKYVFGNIFSQSMTYFFYSLNSAFNRADIFNFNEVHHVNFSFTEHGFDVVSKNSSPKIHHHNHTYTKIHILFLPLEAFWVLHLAL